MIERVVELIEEYNIGMYALDDVRGQILYLSLLYSIDDIISSLPVQWREDFIEWTRRHYDNEVPVEQFISITQGAPSDDDLKPITYIREWFRRKSERS